MKIGKVATLILTTLTGIVMLLASCTKTTKVVEVVVTADSLRIGLVAWYPFNNSASDQSGNGYNGTFYNITSVADRNGNANGAYYFNGLNSYITVGDNMALRLVSSDFTLSAWIKADSYNQSNSSVIFSKRASGAINGGWQLILTGNTANPVGVVSYGPDANSTSAYGTKTVSLSKWHMVTATYSATTQKLSIYVDGVLDNVTSNIVPANNLTSSVLYIGKDSMLPSFYFQGTMDDLRVYNRVLPASQITKLLNFTD